MQNMTKYALKESLKRLMLKKSLDRITINDLTSDCGISRMTFYYHFRDIYDLAEWTCLEESRKADFRVKKLTIPGRKDLYRFLKAVYENKTLVQNACHAIGKRKN